MSRSKEQPTPSASSMPLKRLLDQDPSKFRSIKQVIVLGHLGPTLYVVVEALKILNYKVYDFEAALSRAHRDFPLWVEAASLRHDEKAYTQSDYDKLIGDFNVLADLPTAFFDRELIKLYPNAKVILVANGVKYTALAALLDKAVAKALNFMVPFIHRNHPVHKFQKLSAEYKFDPQHVRETVSEGNLLEIDTFESLKPLCRFLRISEPEVPVNVSAECTITLALVAKTKIPKLLYCTFLYLAHALAMVVQAGIALGPEIAIILAFQRKWISVLLVLAVTAYANFLKYGLRAPSWRPDALKPTSKTCEAGSTEASTIMNQSKTSNGSNGYKRQGPYRNKNRRQNNGPNRNRPDNQDRFNMHQQRRPDRPIPQGWANHQKVIMTKDLEDNKENKAKADEMASQRITFNQVYRQMDRQANGTSNVKAVMQEILE